MAETIVTLSGDDKALFQALQRIVGQQEKVDAGFKKVKASSKEANDAAGSGIDKIVAGLGKWASGFATVTAAGAVVTKMLSDQVAIQEQTLEISNQVAKAQQEAAKNLSGVSTEKISQALQQEVPTIAVEASFKDLAALTKALGSTASIVGEDRASSVVATAAKLERLTPENLQTTATSTGDLVKATGVKDAREAMALLLSAGSVARPEELSRLSLGAARAVNAGTLSAPGQDKVAAAKESTALFAMLSKVDKSGESASTATVQLIDQLRSIFKDRADDPGTTIGRLQAVRQDPQLKEAFLGDLKGEAIFKPLFESLVNETSTEAQELANALQTITTDVKVFDAALKTLEITPQQKIANAQAAAETSVAVKQFGDKSSATSDAIDKITKDALTNSAATTFQKFSNALRSSVDFGIDRSIATPVGFANQSIDTLQMRREQLQSLPSTPEIQDKIVVVDAAIKAISELREVAKAPRDFSNDQLGEQNKLTAENNRLLGEISRKLGGQAQPNSPPPATVPTNSTSNAINAGRP